jgi:hypothetical protein
MEFHDYLSTAAILISLAGFGVAIWSARFSRRAKLAELRAVVLIKAAELSTRLARVYELQAQMRKHAEILGDSIGLELFDASRIEQIQARADSTYSRMATWPSSDGLKVYEALFHELHDLSERALDLEQSSKANRDRYLAISQVPRTGV